MPLVSLTYEADKCRVLSQGATGDLDVGKDLQGGCGDSKNDLGFLQSFATQYFLDILRRATVC